MALITPRLDPKLRKQNLLKDYLLDDLSSCSSNGFRSFPRRQCCTRFLLQIDLANKNNNQFLKSKSAATSPPKKASQAVMKLLQLKPRKLISPRNLSRKFFKRSFWKKSDRKEIQGWRSFHTVVEDKSSPSEFVKTTAVTKKSEKSYSGGSWSDSEFTRSCSSSCSSGNSEAVNSTEKVTVLPCEVVGKRVALIVGKDSTITTPTANYIIDTPKKQWPNEEVKEQFSPVSVLDCPFDNNDDPEAEEEEVSSPFKRRLAHVEGKKHKLMQKLRRFEGLTQLEPVDLEKRIALSDIDHESVGSGPPSQACLLPIQEHNISDQEAKEEHCETDTKAAELLQQLR